MDINKYKLIGKGTTANVYKLDDKRVLKLYHKKIYDERKVRESNILKAITVDKESNINTTKIHEIVETPTEFGVILDYVEGKSLDSLYLFSIKKKCRIIAKLQYDLHNNVHLQEKIYLKDYLKGKILKAEIPKYLEDYISNLLESMPKGEELCHGDFHGGNIIVNKDKFTIIDWAEGGRAEYIADIARTLTLLGVHPYEDFSHKWKEIKGIKNKIIYKVNEFLMKIYLKEYESYRKIDRERLRKWQMIMDAAIIMDRPKALKQLYLKDIVKSYNYFNSKDKKYEE